MQEFFSKIKDIGLLLFLFPLYVIFTPIVFIMCGFSSLLVLWCNFIEQVKEI